VPKPLLQVGKEKILERLIRQLHESPHVDDIYINASYLARLIAEYVSSLTATRRPRVLWESRPMGTAFTVGNLARQTDKPLLVIHGDLVLGTDGLHKFIDMALASEESSVAVHIRELSRARSVITENDGLVTNIQEGQSLLHEHPGEEVWVNSGIYLFQRAHLDFDVEKYIDRNLSPDLLVRLAKHRSLRTQSWDSYRVSVETSTNLEFARKNLPVL
jgi:NDP-sugar pyrophosphorylase family protein